MKTLALMAGAAIIGLAGVAHAQDAVGTGTNTGTDPASRSVSGVAGDTPTANSAAASAGTNNSAGATATTGTTAATDSSTGTSVAADSSTAPAARDASGTAATQSQTASAPAATGTSGASATVQSQWATYDKDKTGGLSPLEFGTWVLAAQGNDLSKQVAQTKSSKRANLPAIKVLNATASEFTKADTDKDRAVSPTELTVYLGG